MTPEDVKGQLSMHGCARNVILDDIYEEYSLIHMHNSWEGKNDASMDLNDAGGGEGRSYHWILREVETCWVRIVVAYLHIHICYLLQA
jgi:hypothetical protein